GGGLGATGSAGPAGTASASGWTTAADSTDHGYVPGGGFAAAGATGSAGATARPDSAEHGVLAGVRRPAGGGGAAGTAAPAGDGGAGSAAGGALRVVVLLPTDVATREQLLAVAELARAEGVQVRVMDPRGSRAETAACMARLAVQLSAARGRLVLGDPFSRLIQALLPFSRARELVVVDDGTATLELAELLLSEAPLVRWHAGGRGGGRFARKAGEILLARPFELFTAMSGPVPLPGNAVLTANRYAWARRRFGAPTVRQGTVDLAGTSLVETGLVPEDRYVEGVAELCRAAGVSRYLAHRRERPEKLARIAAAAGVDVVRPRLPLELAALTEPVGELLLSFPSTVLHTLPLVLAGSPVQVRAVDSVHDWLSPTAPSRAAPFLRRVTQVHVPLPGATPAEAEVPYA
ncbi:hypothetical protein, partial [Streptacidiphilus monticola]